MCTIYRCNSQTIDKMKKFKLKKFIIFLIILCLWGEFGRAEDQVCMSEEALDYLEFAKMYVDEGSYQKAYDYIKMIETISVLDIETLELKKKIMDELGIETKFPVAPNIFEPRSVVNSSTTEHKENKTFTENQDKNTNITVEPNAQLATMTNVPSTTSILTNDNAFSSPKAQMLVQQAQSAFSRGDYAESLNLFLKVKDVENNAIVNNNIGILYKAQNNYSQAVQAFEEATKLDPSYVQPYLNLSMVYKKLKENDKALFYLEKATDVNPNEFGAYYLLGNFYYEQKKYDIAANYYYKAVNIKSDFIEGYCGLGAALFAMEDWENAIKTFERAKTVDENSDKVLYALAKTYIMTKDYKKAKYNLENAMVLNPMGNYMQELAKVNYYLGDYDTAIELYQMALAENDKAELYNNMGLCYYHMKQPKKAVEFFEKAIKENSSKAIYKYNLAIGYKALGKQHLHSKHKDEALSVKPKDAQDYIDLSCIYMDLNDSKNAIEILNQGIEKFPSSKKLYLAKMQYYNANNDTSGYERTKMFYEQKFEN